MNDAMSFMTVILCVSAVYIGIGVLSFKKKTPVHFWTNQKIKAKAISDVKSYNREIGLMWLVYGFSLLLCSLLQIVLRGIMGPLVFVLTLVIGIFVMVNKYGVIYDKYKI